MEESVVHEHEDDSCEKAGEDDTQGRNGESVSAHRWAIQIPECTERCVFQQDDQVVDKEAAARAAFLYIEPAEDVDDPNNHVKDNLLPLGDAELRLAVHNPEGHDAPMQHNENSEVELEHGGKQGKGHDTCCDSEEVPAELDNDGKVADWLLVITWIP